MSRKERRLRRRGDRRELAQLRKLKPVAVYAIRYVDAMAVPNPDEPFHIANRRDDLRAVVLEYQGKPARGRVVEADVVRVPAVRELPARHAGSSREGYRTPSRFLTQPLPPQRQSGTGAHAAPENPFLVGDLEVARRVLHNAAKKLGAEANKRHINHARVAELAVELDAAARAFALARAASYVGRRTA